LPRFGGVLPMAGRSTTYNIRHSEEEVQNFTPRVQRELNIS